MTTDIRGSATNGSRNRLGDPMKRARGLGWFSVGLGLTQVTSPRRMARLVGLADNDTNRNTMLVLGVRGIASGVGILAGERLAAPVWSRVGGDVMDLALLGRAMASARSEKNRVAVATAAVLGVTLVDWLTGHELSRNGSSQTARARTRYGAGKQIEVKRAITIWAPTDQVYRFWRNFENLPQFMQHLESVQILDERRSRWKAKAPAGASVAWDAEIVEDRPNELISWRTLDNADVPSRGAVHFLPAPKGGTEVRVDLHYEAPAGRLGSLVAKLFGEEPGIQVGTDLRRLKQVIELGEVVHSDATVHGRPHPARPSEQRIDVPSAKPRTMQGAGR